MNQSRQDTPDSDWREPPSEVAIQFSDEDSSTHQDIDTNDDGYQADSESKIPVPPPTRTPIPMYYIDQVGDPFYMFRMIDDKYDPWWLQEKK
jgi:hypothetical protein